jgi:hypothetical protein
LATLADVMQLVTRDELKNVKNDAKASRKDIFEIEKTLGNGFNN